MTKKSIRDFEQNDSITGYFGVYSKVLRKTRTNKDYLDVTLMDKTGMIGAKIWDNIDQFKDKFEAGEAVAVKGVVESFNDILQLRIDSIRRIEAQQDAAYGYDPEDIYPTTSKDIDHMWTAVNNSIGNLQSTPLQAVLRKLYSRYADEIKRFPASMTLHHAYRGGLLEHIHSMLQIANDICRIYEFLDKELIIAGILLHDIGKLQELVPGLTTQYSDTGNFIGHIILGRDMFLEAADSIPDFPSSLKMKVEHIILSHQGHLEYQSPKEPAFPEALVVYYIDELDTRLHQMNKDIDADTSDSRWTTKHNYFHRPLFKNRPQDSE